MTLLGPLIFVGLVFLGVFALINWSALNAPVLLSFIAFQLEAPLGLVLLGVTLVFVGLFIAYVLILRTAMLVDTRRHAKELQAQQQLVEKVEASRLHELRSQLERDVTVLQAASEQTRTELDARVALLEQTVLTAIEESGRTLSAYVGEVEDKLDRSLSAPERPRLS